MQLQKIRAIRDQDGAMALLTSERVSDRSTNRPVQPSISCSISGLQEMQKRGSPNSAKLNFLSAHQEARKLLACTIDSSILISTPME
jgi:hypothetical protein